MRILKQQEHTQQRQQLKRLTDVMNMEDLRKSTIQVFNIHANLSILIQYIINQLSL